MMTSAYMGVQFTQNWDVRRDLCCAYPGGAVFDEFFFHEPVYLLAEGWEIVVAETFYGDRFQEYRPGNAGTQGKNTGIVHAVIGIEEKDGLDGGCRLDRDAEGAV